MTPHEIKYGVEEFLTEYNASVLEKRVVRDFMKIAAEEKADQKEAKGAIVLLQLAAEMFL